MRKNLPLTFILLGAIFIALVIVPGAGCKVSQNTTPNNNNDGTNPDDNNEEYDPNAPTVLFMGSSYFAGNNFIGILKSLMKAGGKSLNIHERIVPGAYLSFHAGNDESIRKIYEQDWDYVLLQGGCHYISKPKWHYLIVPYIEELNRMIKDNNEETKTVYLMPWAYEDGLTWMRGEGDTYEEMQRNIYTQALKVADEIGLVIAPVGWAWRTVFQSTEYYVDLYQADYNHPTVNGSYLMACVYYAVLFQESCENLDYYHDLPEDIAKFMQKTASDTVLNDLELWHIVEPSN
jgi:hypothetical protein